MKNSILRDVAQIYRFVSAQNLKNNSLYQNLKSPLLKELLEVVFSFLPDNEEIRFACVERIVGLKEAAILNIFAKYEISEEVRLRLRRILYEITRDFHVKKHKEILFYIKKNSLLTPFLQELLESVHKIGIAFNAFFESWQRELILGINKDLQEKFNGNLQEILEVLESSLEKVGRDFRLEGGFSALGEISDRSYSVPQFRDSKYIAVSYAEFFKDEFKVLGEVFSDCLLRLEKIPEVCKELEQKNEHITYLRALKNALMQTNCSVLLELWRQVDRAWMEISTPLQIGHPLEYYEDHFRKSVAPEWDLRIARIYQGVDLLELDSKGQKDSFKITKEIMLNFYKTYSLGLQKTPFKDEIDSCVMESLQKTQCYGGMPMLFYGAELNGLFSAQVVPNDEKVSAIYGKKIFYFPDRVREIAMAKPFMQLSSLTFSKEFLDFNRELLFFRKNDWYKIYEISTIGHEFGHILWVSGDSELKMNKAGQFKNIEEFKATMGGLAYYFTLKEKPLLKELICNTISRAVSLIAWKKEDEVLPYYCEGLLHLQILFKAKVLRYRGDFSDVALEVCLESGVLESLQKIYLEVYNFLISIYLNKKDASVFLDNFIYKNKDGYYLPKDSSVSAFVCDYYKQYEVIGQLQDTLAPKAWMESYCGIYKE
ncbi:MAG: invasion protein CiaB [Helicobacteraceae bacterium]|nr:invasion protein CiaB [Helicobacteraceae bacterium]